MVLLEDTRASLLAPLPASLASPLRLGADRVTVSTCSEWLATGDKKENQLKLTSSLKFERIPRTGISTVFGKRNDAQKKMEAKGM